MTLLPLPYPTLAALAHGAAACGIVALMAALTTWMPRQLDALLALAMVGIVGGLTWFAAHAARRSRSAANDNDSSATVRSDWQPVDR